MKKIIDMIYRYDKHGGLTQYALMLHIRVNESNQHRVR